MCSKLPLTSTNDSTGLYLYQDVTDADATILKAGQASRSTSPVDDIEYASVSIIGQSKSRSRQVSANQAAHTLEQESVYSPLKHF